MCSKVHFLSVSYKDTDNYNQFYSWVIQYFGRYYNKIGLLDTITIFDINSVY